MHIIEGHYNCGAVRASVCKQDLGESFLSHSPPAVLLCSPLTLTSCDTSGLLENWLRLIRDVYRTHQEQLDQIEVTLS